MQRTYDSGIGLAFLESRLAYIESKIYEKKYGAITYPGVIPVSNEAGEYAQAVVYYYMDGAAVAEFVGTRSLNVPVATIAMDKETVGVELGATGYEYSDEEIRQAMQLGQNLPQSKADVCMQAYEQKAQRVAMSGDASHNFYGFINNPNVTAATVVNPGSGTEWVNKTPDEILTDVNTVMGGIFVDTLQAEMPDTLALPTAQYNYIAGTPRSATSDTTIMRWLLNNSPYLSGEGSIKPVAELTGAGAGATDRMVAYKNDSEKLVFHVPMPLRFLAPQRKGRGFEVPAEFKLAGVEVRYPGSMRYADGI